MTFDGAPTVVKLGGSLLDLPQLGPRLRTWLDGLESPVILIIGGGRTADIVRDWDRLHSLGDETAHSLALRALTFNSHFIQSILASSRVVGSLDECGVVWRNRQTPILDPFNFWGQSEAPEHKLPASWDVTSDSIAAKIAWQAGARELVLLKSKSPPQETTWLELARMGLVDAYFPRMVDFLASVRIVNFRAGS